jgi:hypothetical protein
MSNTHRRRAPNREMKLIDARHQPVPDWAKAGIEQDLFLINRVLESLQEVEERLVACIAGCQMHATRRFVQGIERLPVNVATARLLKQARESGVAALNDRLQELREKQTTRPNGAPRKPRDDGKAVAS